MNIFDDLRRELRPIFEERASRLFSAQVLSEGDQLLSAGQAAFASDEPVGVFWPQNQLQVDKNLATGTILRKSGARDVSLRNFKLCACPSLIGIHYHFSVESDA
jgi:hypothetical protein